MYQFNKERDRKKSNLGLIYDNSTMGIKLGERYKDKINSLIESSIGAIIFISKNSEDSEFINSFEIPKILEIKKINPDFLILPILIDRPSSVDSEILEFQLPNAESTALREQSGELRKLIIEKFVFQILETNLESFSGNSNNEIINQEVKKQDIEEFIEFEKSRKGKNNPSMARLAILGVLVAIIILFISRLYSNITSESTISNEPAQSTTVLDGLTTETSDLNARIYEETYLAEELIVGECFDVIGDPLILEKSSNVILKNCYSRHDFEIYSEVELQVDLSTQENQSDVVFENCKEAFYERFQTFPISVGAYIDFIGQEFTNKSIFKCIVMAESFDNNGKFIEKLDESFTNYIVKFENNSKKVTFTDLKLGSCFNTEKFIGDLFLDDVVDERNCNDAHHYEVIKILDIPEELNETRSISNWGFEVCNAYGSSLISLKVTNSDRYEEIYPVDIKFVIRDIFDENKYLRGETSQVYCIVETNTITRTALFPKNESLLLEIEYDVFNLSYIEGVPVLEIVCTNKDFVKSDGALAWTGVFINNVSPPFKSFIVEFTDSRGEYFADLTQPYLDSEIGEQEFIGFSVDVWFMYYMANQGVEIFDLLETGEVEIYNITFTLVDGEGAEFVKSCDL